MKREKTLLIIAIFVGLSLVFGTTACEEKKTAPPSNESDEEKKTDETVQPFIPAVYAEKPIVLESADEVEMIYKAVTEFDGGAYVVCFIISSPISRRQFIFYAISKDKKTAVEFINERMLKPTAGFLGKPHSYDLTKIQVKIGGMEEKIQVINGEAKKLTEFKVIKLEKERITDLNLE